MWSWVWSVLNVASLINVNGQLTAVVDDNDELGQLIDKVVSLESQLSKLQATVNRLQLSNVHNRPVDQGE